MRQGSGLATFAVEGTVDIPKDFDLQSYAYDLPRESIAQSPAQRRDGSRLMLLDRMSGRNSLHGFGELGSLLPEGALLVANNSRVVPARLSGRKQSGGKVELLLLTPLPLLAPRPFNGQRSAATCQCLLRSSKAVRVGESVFVEDCIEAVVVKRSEFGRCKVELRWSGDLRGIVERLGHVPLPPYIARPDGPEDMARYQTVYADAAKAGSVAAPTAGLHFTQELRQGLRERGFGWAEVTLYVGYGTFSPVRCRDIREHRMHEEHIEVSGETASAVAAAKDQGRPVVAVGTTSARTLEGMHRALQGIGPYSGPTDIFIMPGYGFSVVDALLTNFHLPESSLLIMVSALAGRRRILDAYAEALQGGFRFFSYGDAMLIR